MADAIKYQKRIHDAFADEVLISEKRKALEEALADKPELLAAMKDNPFESAEADAIIGGNVAICEYFATKSEEGDALVFSTEHFKTVKQTVKTNLAYYKNILQFIKDEKEDDYSKIYKAIKTKLDAYFERAAEDILNDVYGEKYKKFFDEKYAEFAEDAKKNSSKKNKDAE